MDAARKLLRQLIEEANTSEAELSRKVRKNNASYINQYFTKNSPRVLPEDVRDKLGQIFTLHPDSFKTGRRVAVPKRARLLLNYVDGEQLGRVEASGATKLTDGAMALIFQLDDGRELVLPIDRPQIDRLRQNLVTLEDEIAKMEPSASS